MSVWESLDALRAFVYSSRAHLDVLRRRREWFERLGEAYVVLWWVPALHRPSVEEAERRLDLLRRLGPSPEAFAFRAHFPPPQPAAAERAKRAPAPVRDDRELCPAG